MKLSPTTTPISDAARYFSQRKNKPKQQKKVKPETLEFRYPVFEHPEHYSGRYQRGR